MLAPPTYEEFRADIYDVEGEPLGYTEVQHLERGSAGAYLRLESRVGDRTVYLLEAQLEPVATGNALRPLWQRTRRLSGSQGREVVLQLDHRAERATCQIADGPIERFHLPARERIANVPMMLALRPLAAGNAEQARFQMFMCEGWRRIVEVEARAIRRVDGVAEVRYRFDIGPILSTLLRPWLPDIRIWLQSTSPNDWIGQQSPLYHNGPNVYIIRHGFDVARFLEAPSGR